jgi:chromosome segregation ATPase
LDGRFDCSKDQAELEGAKANIKTVEAKLTAATKENEKMIESANNVQNSLRDEIDRLHNVIADKDRQIEGLLTTRCATEQQRYDNAQRAYQNSVPSLLVCDYESAGGQCRRREGEPFLADAVQRAQAILTACLSAQSR